MDRYGNRMSGESTREGVMDEKPKQKDRVLVLGTKGDDVLISRRKENGEVTVGEATRIKEGKPLPSSGEIVYLKERAEGCPMYDVVDSFKLGNGPETEVGSGPAMVSSPVFRANWDSIFGGNDEQLN